MFCREQVGDLRRLSGTRTDYPDVLFFHLGTPDDASAFFPSRWKEARAVSDPDGAFYRGFGLGRGSLGQLFGPSVVACSLRAASKGHGIGRPVGDPLQMPGIFYVAGDLILWRHDFAHAGDHPDFDRLTELLPKREET